MIDPKDKEELKGELEAEKGRLNNSLLNLADPDPDNKSRWRVRYPNFRDEGRHKDDPSDENADEVEEFETILETKDALLDRLNDVAIALNKFECGSYGICDKYENEIPILRLRANPAARLHTEHYI